MEILLYRAFWLEHPERFPMGMEALSSYIWLQQAFLSLFAMWNWENDILESVKTPGSIGRRCPACRGWSGGPWCRRAGSAPG